MHTTSTDPPSQTYMMNFFVVFCYGVKFDFSAEAGVESTVALFCYFPARPSAFLTVREKFSSTFHISHVVTVSRTCNTIKAVGLLSEVTLLLNTWNDIGTILLFQSFQRITDV